MGDLADARKYWPPSSCLQAANPLLLGRNRSGEWKLTIAFAWSPKACKASKIKRCDKTLEYTYLFLGSWKVIPVGLEVILGPTNLTNPFPLA